MGLIKAVTSTVTSTIAEMWEGRIIFTVIR